MYKNNTYLHLIINSFTTLISVKRKIQDNDNKTKANSGKKSTAKSSSEAYRRGYYQNPEDVS